MTEDTSRGRGVSTTIKNGKGYEESWHGFTGSPEAVREDIITYFGLDRESVAGLTAFEVSITAERIAHSAKNAVRTLGATPVKPADQVDPAAAPAGDVWAQADAATAETSATPAQAPVEGPNPLLAQIEDVTEIPALQRLWAENQAAFADAEVMDAWKAKGKALQAAAA